MTRAWARRYVLPVLCLLAVVVVAVWGVHIYRVHEAAYRDFTRVERRHTGALARELDVFLRSVGNSWPVRTDVDDNWIILRIYAEPDEASRNEVIHAAKGIVDRQNPPVNIRLDFVRGSPDDKSEKQEVVSSHILKP